MTISLKNKKSSVEADVQTIAGRMLSTPIISCERIGGGLNSRVYQLEAKNALKYILKFYYRDYSDGRDRLATEFSSLTFLWRNGVRFIPEPIVAAQEEGCAIYEYVEGGKIISGELTTDDIDQSVRFLEKLKILASKSAAMAFPPASEACFSFQDIVKNIEWRLKRLEVPASKDKDLGLFLTNDFSPFLKVLVKWYKENSTTLSDSEVIQEERTLSPSDFGFHNALKRKDGRIVFLDFEYFGWDDPAKMISDFLLHPAMSLSQALKQRFLSELRGSSVFPERERIFERVKFVYPFFGLKWCLIFLNEFISDDLRRRNFAQKILNDKNDVERRQLLKAKNALALVKETYQNFPFDYVIR